MSEEKVCVTLNPDGFRDFGLLVVVRAPTGVVYRNQCGGYYCLQLTAEGFAVPVGDVEAAKEIVEFFDGEFEGWPPDRGESWNESNLAELEAIVAKMPCWKCGPKPGRDEEAFLKLDRTRLDEMTEAWIPVVTADGPGILTFENSD